MKPRLEVWILLIENNRTIVKSKKLYKDKLPLTIDKMLERECAAIEKQMFLEELLKAQVKALNDSPLMLDRYE